MAAFFSEQITQWTDRHLSCGDCAEMGFDIVPQ